jgi:hypothetical protein
MTWKAGQSGNPSGGPGRPKEKPFADALRIVLAEDDPTTQKRKLRVIAEKLVTSAMEGEPWAVKEVMDRIDGKPVQTVDATIERRTANELSDGELHDIARSGGKGASAKANGSADPNRVH